MDEYFLTDINYNILFFHCLEFCDQSRFLVNIIHECIEEQLYLQNFENSEAQSEYFHSKISNKLLRKDFVSGLFSDLPKAERTVIIINVTDYFSHLFNIKPIVQQTQ